MFSKKNLTIALWAGVVVIVLINGLIWWFRMDVAPFENLLQWQKVLLKMDGTASGIGLNEPVKVKVEVHLTLQKGGLHVMDGRWVAEDGRTGEAQLWMGGDSSGRLHLNGFFPSNPTADVWRGKVVPEDGHFRLENPEDDLVDAEVATKSTQWPAGTFPLSVTGFAGDVDVTIDRVVMVADKARLIGRYHWHASRLRPNAVKGLLVVVVDADGKAVMAMASDPNADGSRDYTHSNGLLVHKDDGCSYLQNGFGGAIPPELKKLLDEELAK